MYRPSAFSPTFDCTVDFLSNTPIVITSAIGIDVLPLDGGYVLFESLYGRNCVFEYTSATAEGDTITLYCTASSWSESNFYTDPTSPFVAQDSAIGTISRTITSADWNDIVDHVLNKSNPHDVTKEDVGLGNADNTSDADKPISTATQNALDSKADLVEGKVPYDQLPEISTLELGTAATTAFYGDKGQIAYLHSQITDGNPHGVDKADVGLGNADNTSDADKPVSTAQQEAIDGVQTNITNHINNKNNPHEVDKEDVGLGNVNNTSDADKPISTATQAALNLKADQTSFDLVSSFVGYTPQTLIVSDPTQTAIDAVQNNLDDHVGDKNNPHDVDKADVGLGNVDNTSDANKPISTATQEALDDKLDANLTSANHVLITDASGNVETESQATAFNKPFSDSSALSPTITGSAGSDEYVSRSDHQHPSETFTISAISVLSTGWSYDGTYTSYPYKASISNSNVTSSHTPIVVFSQECASLGIYSQVAETASGTITIYASEIPTDTTVIRTIVLIKET